VVHSNIAIHLQLCAISLLVGTVLPRLLAGGRLTKHRNVGFLRYWTLSNVPLFLLALPALTLLLYSGGTAIAQSSYRIGQADGGDWLVIQMAIPQMVLASLAITNYHVQVITRFSSGYPWVYIWLAKQICLDWRYAGRSVRFFIMYGLIQAALFASFLPPA
jgi:phosphatidylinositol glycan class V